MKVILVLTAVVVAMAAPPAPQAAPQRPSGRLILLPARQQYPPPAEGATTSTPTPTPSTRRAPEAQTEKPEAKSDKLVDAGEYYVLTPEGKLQMVKYMTSALKSPARPTQVNAQPEPFAQFQIEYLQYPSFSGEPSPAQVRAEEEDDSAESSEESGFQAKLQFRDVKPIPAPIYAYNPAPAVRILKK